MRFLLNLMRIRRLEFLVVEITIFLIPILATIHHADQIANRVVAEAFLLFFVLYALGDGINCLMDRDLDAVYKTHLSRAVYELGVPLVVAITVGEAVVALGLAMHLSWITGKWLFLPLVVVGLFLGITYSMKPLHFKARGVWHLICLWLLLYFIPMIYAAAVVSDFPALEVVVLAGSYATAEMGVILVNTAEDYPEDRAAGIRTTIVALGLPRGIAVARWMVLGGSASLVTTFLVLHLERRWSVFGWISIALLISVCGRITWLLWRLLREVRDHDLNHGIRAVKLSARQVPLWATAIGWCGVLCALSLALES